MKAVHFWSSVAVLAAGFLVVGCGKDNSAGAPGSNLTAAVVPACSYYGQAGCTPYTPTYPTAGTLFPGATGFTSGFSMVQQCSQHGGSYRFVNSIELCSFSVSLNSTYVQKGNPLTLPVVTPSNSVYEPYYLSVGLSTYDQVQFTGISGTYSYSGFTSNALDPTYGVYATIVGSGQAPVSLAATSPVVTAQASGTLYIGFNSPNPTPSSVTWNLHFASVTVTRCVDVNNTSWPCQ